MSSVLDHLIVFCSPRAPEADALVRLGFTEGSRNTHPGQGTANRRFFFSNAFLELLWISDPAELESAPVRRVGLRERWSGDLAGACPFGVVLRPATPADVRPPFRSWAYRPAYMPGGLAIDVAEDVPVTEPMLVHIGVARDVPVSMVEPTRHALGVSCITGVSIEAPLSEPPSPAMSAVAASGVLSLRSAERALMTVTFDNAASRASADLRPVMPLVLRW